MPPLWNNFMYVSYFSVVVIKHMSNATYRRFILLTIPERQVCHSGKAWQQAADMVAGAEAENSRLKLQAHSQ